MPFFFLNINRETLQIYWCDANKDRIEVSDYDGSNRYVVYSC